MDASIELFRNGDIAVTTNGVTELIPRIHPSDTDGDGILDMIDPNLGIYDGDFFGPRDELPQGANTNAYCWVDVVVSNADAEVLFAGDGPSNLPDPHFMARAGVTNRVTILIGKGYAVYADERIECVGMADSEIEVTHMGETAIFVRRPVTITFEDGTSPPMRDGSSHGISRTLNVIPDCLGGEFQWKSSHCCDISMSGLSLAWNCCGECGCGGCQAIGRYVYEGYGLDVSGGNCGCSPSSPSVESSSLAVSFSEDALFYEEAYTNQPDEVVGRRISTNVTFVCTAYGGQFGGTFNLVTMNLQKLLKMIGDDLPVAPVEVAPYETRTWNVEYAPKDCSGEANDITAMATFMETLSGNVMCATAATTVVKLALTPSAPRQGCDNRHLLGVGESVWCVATPNAGQWGETGEGELDNGMATMSYICPLTSDGSVLYYEVGRSRYNFDHYHPTQQRRRIMMSSSSCRCHSFCI